MSLKGHLERDVGAFSIFDRKSLIRSIRSLQTIDWTQIDIHFWHHLLSNSYFPLDYILNLVVYLIWTCLRIRDNYFAACSVRKIYGLQDVLKRNEEYRNRYVDKRKSRTISIIFWSSAAWQSSGSYL